MADLSDRKPNSFTPVVTAMELADYVLLITGNPKSFPTHKADVKQSTDGRLSLEVAMLDDTLVNKVREQAYQIYMMASRANRINLRYQPYRKQKGLRKSVYGSTR